MMLACRVGVHMFLSNSRSARLRFDSVECRMWLIVDVVQMQIRATFAYHVQCVIPCRM